VHVQHSQTTADGLEHKTMHGPIPLPQGERDTSPAPAGNERNVHEASRRGELFQKGDIMHRHWILPMAALALFIPATGMAQEKGVTLKTVKYAGLKDAVLKNRGKVVVVDVWFRG